MRVIRFPTAGLAALLVLGGGLLRTATADEAGATGAGREILASQGELDAVSLNVVDEKLALSLAVETHIQIELAGYALGGVHDEELKRFTDTKLQTYRRLLNTLEVLTDGRAVKVLRPPRAAHAAQGSEVVPVTDDGAAPAASANVARTARNRRKSSINDVIQNAAMQAALRVRLEIAQQFAHLLRAELETAPPGEFDRRYLTVEAFNQMQVLAMLRVFEQQASKEFGVIIHHATEAAEAHALEGRRLAERLRQQPPIQPAAPQVVNTAEPAGM
jgi:hypothetical protein